MTRLSPRELEVVVLVGRDGKQWETVATRMGLSLGTVRSYVARIMLKAGSTRAPREALTEIYWREVAWTDADATADAVAVDTK